MNSNLAMDVDTKCVGIKCQMKNSKQLFAGFLVGKWQ